MFEVGDEVVVDVRLVSDGRYLLAQYRNRIAWIDEHTFSGVVTRVKGVGLTVQVKSGTMAPWWCAYDSVSHAIRDERDYISRELVKMYNS